MNKKKKSQQGVGLIEMLITVMVTALMLTAVAILLTMSVRNTSEARYREVAVNESQEVIEHLRRYRTTEGWDIFWNFIDSRGQDFDTFCITTDIADSAPNVWLVEGTNLDTCAYQLNTEYKGEFKRTLTVEIDRTNNPPTSLKAIVETSWIVGSTERSVVFEQLFTEYQ